ncbi:MAG TPA: universal stress protein [Acidimicrobiales bacterium]|nr:universal stress protein [Acidimicrobiales bacterium]
MFEKILVALDESDHSKKALATAGDLAEMSKGEVRVVHVREVPLGMGGPLTPIEPSQQAQTYVDEAVKTLADRGITASGDVRNSHNGRIASEIIDEAHNFGASVIVLGSKGVTELEGLVIGSVAHKVLHLSTLPVVVVR